jgi:hypothetical protein
MVRCRRNFVPGLWKQINARFTHRLVAAGVAVKRHRRANALSLVTAYPLSWPGLSRPSTFLIRQEKQNVDARDKRGHDEPI